MTPIAVEARPRLAQAGSWTRPPGLGWMLMASHLAAALAAVLLVLLGRSLELPAAGPALVSLAPAAALGLWAMRRIAQPISGIARAAEAAVSRFGRSGVRPAGRDVGDLARLASACRKLERVLADVHADHDRLAAEIAHEIRNPLASLRCAAEALREADPVRKDVLARVVEEDVLRLDRLVGEMSRASRLDIEFVRGEAAVFDVAAMVREVVGLLSASAARRGVELAVDLPDESVTAEGLEMRLAQVVNNVVENAISLCEEDDAVRVRVRRHLDRVLIVVEDTGPGIPEGEAERIFRRFYTARPAEASAANCGLGLSIARQIVEAHRGTIWAENIRPTNCDLLSEPLGARFVIVLPA